MGFVPMRAYIARMPLRPRYEPSRRMKREAFLLRLGSP